MQKSYVIDELIDYFILKAVEEGSNDTFIVDPKSDYAFHKKKHMRGEKEHGLYSATGIRKQA